MVTIALRSHLFSFRTQKLSSAAPKVLVGQPAGRIGCCHFPLNLVISDSKVFSLSSCLLSGYGCLTPTGEGKEDGANFVLFRHSVPPHFGSGPPLFVLADVSAVLSGLPRKETIKRTARKEDGKRKGNHKAGKKNSGQKTPSCGIPERGR